ncbi:Acetoin utilization deacetylase AcuC [Salinihabitans flavidus]|uniref:Acetoin utilization deacetylase AcuC n=1 Tax=Salinihabitans flavidus TaxID=569882 RepID=A0A1H8UN78_9RHOB|nr:histone deacetylase family protein [Salinihabitans flavidus]SEP04670.1 Acetoin utilization deacetylase AcuC [Salinihabitans flavidus]
MTTALYTHPDCLDHIMPPGHPEQVARMAHVSEALSAPSFAALDRRDAPLCSDADVLLGHPQRYFDRLQTKAPVSGTRPLDADTHISPGSLTAARRAVGGAIAAVDAVLSDEVSNAFVACRPPGHHAEQEKPMGFCLLGTAAIAAKHALDRHGLSRVAVVDFDVHHGNGTQALLWNEPRALFVSSHQMPLWPGSGHPHETGGHDNVINLPLAPMSSGAEMRRTYESEVFPALIRFAPELLILSAGFDAHTADPLAQLDWTTEDFTWLTAQLCDVAREVCGGRVVSTLEGGYDLKALANSSAAHVHELMRNGTA